jgi:4a-hydroxytetrahydrobiopterin dehydratase
VGVDTARRSQQTGHTVGDEEASIRPQAGNDAWEVAMRVKRRDRAWSGDYLSDALSLLAGWTSDGRELRRTLRIDDSQHAALAERIKVVADALQLRPDIRRLDGHTQIKVRTPDGLALSDGEVTLAARIEDMYRAITGAE